MSPELVRHSFPAMGGVVDVQIVGERPGAGGLIERVFEKHEQALSRFRSDSELSALNASPTAAFHASPLLFDAVSEAIGWACITDGVFDPTTEDMAGDRPGQHDRGAVSVLNRSRVSSGRWRRVALDFERETIVLPADARINLDGIGKGYTVDRAIAAIGPCANALVSASGDLYAAGDGPDGDGWYIGVQDPFAADTDMMVLNINDRAVATCGRAPDYGSLADRRATSRADDSETDLLAVTVVALTATQADVLAKTALHLGSDAGVRMIERFDAAECIAVSRTGKVLTTSGLSEYLA